MVSLFWFILVAVSFLLLLRYRTSALVAGVFILFGLMTRTIALAYVDLFGPFFAEQLDADIGGSSSSMPLFALSVLVFLLALAIIFRPSKLRNALNLPLDETTGARDLGNVFFFSALAYIALLYGDMLRRGVIPLLENMERYDYAKLYAGPFHSALFEYGFLLVGMLGAFFVYPRLTGNGYRYRFIGLLIALFAYFVLTGHRFSAFFSFSSFFLLPLASVFVLQSMSALPALERSRSFVQKILVSKATRRLSVIAMMLMLSALIFNSLTKVRDYDNPLEKLIQRILIQPVELWWTTWDRLVERGEWTPSLAWDLMFDHPFDANRNTGIQFLMVKALGYDRAEELLLQDSQYAGGYPEILFELVGPYAALPVALLFSLITALLLRMIVLAVCRGNFGTVFMGIYVYYGFSLLFIGGMLNFLIAATFLLKVATLILVYMVELKYYRNRRRLSARMPPIPKIMHN